MQITDEPRPPSRPEDPFAKEVKTIFHETLGLIHITLVTHYGLEETDATELEKDLYVWFLKFCKRPVSRSPRESRPFLLVAACQFGREYQKYLVGAGVREADSKLREILDREPEEVARDFSRSLEILNFRYHADA